MRTLQRLPLIRILLAHIGGKVFFQEHPAPADSGGGNAPHGGALAQRGRMQLQEDGCFLEIERAHGACAGCETYVIGSGLSPLRKGLGPGALLRLPTKRRIPRPCAGCVS
jgi:hypothetical protein